MRKQQEVLLFGNLMAMIDVVFQIIIFFVCTSALQDSARDANIHLAMAPHGQQEGQKNPLTVEIEVTARGDLKVAAQKYSQNELLAVMRNAGKAYGAEHVPVIIRADGRATHDMVRKAMDMCASAGIWQIKIAALKEAGSYKK
jgi:biopolymer transport protein ExbD